jgi:hypothetical protein
MWTRRMWKGDDRWKSSRRNLEENEKLKLTNREAEAGERKTQKVFLRWSSFKERELSFFETY